MHSKSHNTIEYNTIEKARNQIAEGFRIACEAIRYEQDIIALQKVQSESIRAYIVTSLIEIYSKFKTDSKIDNTQEPLQILLKKTQEIIKQTKGLIHIQLDKTFGENLTYLSDDMEKFLKIQEDEQEPKIFIPHRNRTYVMNSFIEKFMPEDAMPGAKKLFETQQERFYKYLVYKGVHRLPNLLLTIKTGQGFSSVVVHTYTIYLENYEFFGVLHISHYLSENLSVEKYKKRLRDKNLVFPKPEQITSLQTLVDLDEKYLPALQEINETVDAMLKESILKESISDITDSVENVLSLLREYEKEPSSFLQKAQQLVNDSNLCLQLVTIDQSQRVIASSRRWLEGFWKLKREDILEKPTWNYYQKTYRKIKNDHPEDNDHLFKYIARQQRRSILTREYPSSYPLGVFIRKGDEYFKLYSRIIYTQSKAVNFPIILFLIQEQSVSKQDFHKWKEGSKALQEKDALADLLIPFSTLAVGYDAVFHLMDCSASSPDLMEEAKDIITKTKGLACLEIDGPEPKVFSSKMLLNFLKLSETFVAQNLEELFGSYFFSILPKEEKTKDGFSTYNRFIEDLNENRNLSKAGIGRLPNIFIFFQKGKKYIVAIFYAFTIYLGNKRLGTLYVYQETPYKDKEDYQKRIDGLFSFNAMVKKGGDFCPVLSSAKP